MDPTTATARLQAANASHDRDPVRGAALLREIAPAALDPGQRPLYALLLNHVLAEKLHLPAEAWQRQQALLAVAGQAPPMPLLRHAGAAARLAGDTVGESRLGALLAASAGTSPAQAGELLALAAASFTVPGLAGDEAGLAALEGLRPLRGAAWQQASGLDAAAAALANNLASGLAEERTPAELRLPAVREAAAEAAALAQAVWQRAGHWVQHERAHYLRALVANALGDATLAAQQAHAGLALLDNHDTEHAQSVDRAFLQLELSHALARQGQAAEASVARTQADTLADAFDDSSLTDWFKGRVTRQAELDAAAR
jgi:hypothetical protein